MVFESELVTCSKALSFILLDLSMTKTAEGSFVEIKVGFVPPAARVLLMGTLNYRSVGRTWVSGADSLEISGPASSGMALMVVYVRFMSAGSRQI